MVHIAESRNDDIARRQEAVGLRFRLCVFYRSHLAFYRGEASRPLSAGSIRMRSGPRMERVSRSRNASGEVSCCATMPPWTSAMRRVGVWRGGFRLSMSVAAPFVWRCLSGSAVAPFPHPPHRTGQADFLHPALGQDLTPSSTARRAQADPDVRARSARKGAREDSSRPCVA